MFDKRRFMAQMVLADMSQKELARALDIDESTLYRKINNNGSFSRKEMNILIDVLNIEDPIPIFFAPELT